MKLKLVKDGQIKDEPTKKRTKADEVRDRIWMVPPETEEMAHDFAYSKYVALKPRMSVSAPSWEGEKATKAEYLRACMCCNEYAGTMKRKLVYEFIEETAKVLALDGDKSDGAFETHADELISLRIPFCYDCFKILRSEEGGIDVIILDALRDGDGFMREDDDEE